jgi:hypothetical protein
MAEVAGEGGSGWVDLLMCREDWQGLRNWGGGGWAKLRVGNIT